MNLFDFNFFELSENDNLESFDCGEKEINKFLKEDSVDFQNEKMTNTFIFKNNKDEVVIFFSISNDCLNDIRYENNVWNKLHRKYKDYKYRPINWFGGHTECYTTKLPIEEIINYTCQKE